MTPKQIPFVKPEIQFPVSTRSDGFEFHSFLELIGRDFVLALAKPIVVLALKQLHYRVISHPLIPLGLRLPKCLRNFEGGPDRTCLLTLEVDFDLASFPNRFPDEPIDSAIQRKSAEHGIVKRHRLL